MAQNVAANEHPSGWEAPGQWLLLLVVLVSILFWVVAQPDLSAISDNWLLSAGRLSGIVGVTLYVNNILLSTRLKIFEYLFGGLNRVYRVHHTQGGLAFIFMLLHPMLLIAARWSYPSLIRTYLIPSAAGVESGYTSGVLALSMLIALLSITYWAKIPYQWWKRTHYLIGIPGLFLILHIARVPSDVSRSNLLKWWLLALLVAALLARAYKFVWLRYVRRGKHYNITSIQKLGAITEISAEPTSTALNYLPGQFAYVTFNGSVSKEEHPYSISTYDASGKIRFSIKNSGDFTATLDRLKVDDTCDVHGAFGIFGHGVYETKNPIVMVAGGIGITPFLSLLTWLSVNDKTRKVTLYYSVSVASEAVYKKELTQLAVLLSNLTVKVIDTSKEGFLDAKKILADSSPKAKPARYLICGPPAMQHALTAQLLKAGVSNLRIETEVFSL